MSALVRSGSISAAARSLGMSYRRAWLLVDTMNQSFKSPVVETLTGGQKGGGARVTDTGHEVLRRYLEMEAKAAASVNEQEKVNLNQKIDQCNNKINPFVNAEMAGKTDNSETPVIQATTVATSSENTAAPETKPEVTSSIIVDSAISVTGETGNVIVAEQVRAMENDSTLNLNYSQQNTETEQHAGEDQKIELIETGEPAK